MWKKYGYSKTTFAQDIFGKPKKNNLFSIKSRQNTFAENIFGMQKKSKSFLSLPKEEIKQKNYHNYNKYSNNYGNKEEINGNTIMFFGFIVLFIIIINYYYITLPILFFIIIIYFIIKNNGKNKIDNNNNLENISDTKLNEKSFVSKEMYEIRDIYKKQLEEIDEKLIDTNNMKIVPVFTKEELRFYNWIKEKLKDKNLNVLSKIRIADFVKPTEYIEKIEWRKTFNKINRKHIDFIITDIQGKIKVLIELDGDSHQKEETIESDKLKNYLFDKLNIPLERYKNGEIFELSKIQKYIITNKEVII